MMWYSMFIVMIFYHRLSTVTILIYWGLVTHICVSRSVIIGSGNDLSPVLHYARPITWTNAAFLSVGISRTFQWIYNQNSNIFIQESAFENAVMYLEMKSSNGWVKQHYVIFWHHNINTGCLFCCIVCMATILIKVALYQDILNWHGKHEILPLTSYQIS